MSFCDRSQGRFCRTSRAQLLICANVAGGTRPESFSIVPWENLDFEPRESRLSTRQSTRVRDIFQAENGTAGGTAK